MDNQLQLLNSLDAPTFHGENLYAIVNVRIPIFRHAPTFVRTEIACAEFFSPFFLGDVCIVSIKIEPWKCVSHNVANIDVTFFMTLLWFNFLYFRALIKTDQKLTMVMRLSWG